jgi:hypothetical protein
MQFRRRKQPYRPSSQVHYLQHEHASQPMTSQHSNKIQTLTSHIFITTSFMVFSALKLGGRMMVSVSCLQDSLSGLPRHFKNVPPPGNQAPHPGNQVPHPGNKVPHPGNRVPHPLLRCRHAATIIFPILPRN